MSIDKCLALFWIVLLAASAGCDARFVEEKETDAELFCREQGYEVDSEGYNDCVENWPESQS